MKKIKKEHIDQLAPSSFLLFACIQDYDKEKEKKIAQNKKIKEHIGQLAPPPSSIVCL